VTRTPLRVAAVVTAVGLLLSAAIYAGLAQREAQNAHFAVALEARRAQEKLLMQLEQRVLALQRMANRWAVLAPEAQKPFAADARDYAHDMPGFLAIGYLDPQAVVQAIEPQAGNEGILGRNMVLAEPDGAHCTRALALQRSRALRTPSVTQQVELLQGGKGLLIFAPIFLGDTYLGSIYAALHFKATVPALLGHDFVQTFGVSLSDVKGQAYANRLAGVDDLGPFATEVGFNLRDSHFTVRIVPTAARLRTWHTALPVWVGVACALCSLLLGYVAYLSLAARARAELLHTTDMRQKAIVDGAVQSIICTDVNGLIEEFNGGAERLLGYTAEEVVGRCTPDIFHRQSFLEQRATLLSAELQAPVAANVEALMARARKLGEESVECVYVRKDGSEVDVLLAITVLRNRMGEIVSYIGIATDISASKKVEAQLIFAKQAAEEANQARSKFFAQMSHEIRTPLNGVLGMTGLLLDTPLSDEQRRYAQIVNSSGNHLLALVDDILDLAKIDAGRVRLECLPFDLVAVMEAQATACVQESRRKKVPVLTFIDPRIPRKLLGDPGRLGQIVSNLLSNALKFTERGHILVRADWLSAHDGACNLHFRVTDTGSGMADAAQENLFVPFSQVEGSVARKALGTGLGLALCQQLVQLMGGSIAVDSKVGQGSTFHFTFLLRTPVQLDAAPAVPGAPGDEALAHAARKDAQDPWGVQASVQQPLRGKKAAVLGPSTPTALVLGEYLAGWGAQVVQRGLPAPPIDALPATDLDYLLLDISQASADAATVAACRRLLPATARFVPYDGSASLTLAPEGAQAAALAAPVPPGDGDGAQSAGVPEVLRWPYGAENFLHRLTGAGGNSTQPSKSVPPADLNSLSSAPAAAASAATPSGGPASAAAAAAPGRRVLVVDDNKVNQLLAVSLCRKLGYAAQAVNNGVEALAALEVENFNVVLMDCQMPLMDGYEATRQLRQKEHRTGGHLPVIALTAQALTGDEALCRQAGMDAYTTKPISRATLDALLRQWSAKGQGYLR
jgi:two-component system sensor histidine kinase/response regulator